jgi:hypothetical protein
MSVPNSPNPSNATPKGWTQFWTAEVGTALDLTTQFPGTPARRIVVGVVPAEGTLVLTQQQGTAVTFTAAQILAMGQVLDGQWTGVTASGSTCYQLAVGW